jgi:protease-4
MAGILIITAMMPDFGGKTSDFKVKDGLLHIDLEQGFPEKADFDFNFFSGVSKKPVPFYKAVRVLSEVASDDRIKAILLTGEMTNMTRPQTEEFYKALKELKGKKPIYAYADNIHLRNAMLFCLADSVFIPEIGSVYFTGLSMEPWFYKGLLDKLGIGVDVVMHGKFKGGMENFTRESFSEPFAVTIRDLLDDIYSSMRSQIAEVMAFRKGISTAL